MSTPIGDDALSMAKALIGVMKDAGWRVPTSPLIGGIQGNGIEVDISLNASSQAQSAADALVKALREVPLKVNGPNRVGDQHTERIGTEVILPPFDKDTIVLTVLTHP